MPRFPDLPRRALLALALLPAAFGGLMFLYRYGDVLARARHDPALGILVEEMTGAYSAVPSLLVLLAATFAWPLTRATWKTRLPLHAGLILVLGALATLLMWASRSVLFPWFGLGPYDYGNLLWRIPMELGLQTILYSMAIGLFHYIRYYRETRGAQLRAAELEAALARAQVDAIEARLEPHFIFNALNTISSVMDEDVAEADRLLGRLADLLRRAMTRNAPATVPLHDELEWLGSYLALMERRFGPRLSVRVATGPGTDDVPVPRFLLQPLVENAIRHGVAAKGGPGLVEISAARNGSHLVLEVRDDGNGLGSSPDQGAGIGLSATAERLALLYGSEHRFEVVPGSGGGTVARIEIPIAEAAGG